MDDIERSPQKDQKSPFQTEIQKSTETGFLLDTCFQEETKDQGYEKLEDYYFDSYSHFSIHEQMLRDKNRTKAYQNAIMRNKHVFENKIVLDVGSGTGILSIFAAKAGAKHVYAVEKANIAKFAQQIIKDNNLQDKITVLNCMVEEAVLPVEKVDIIISEWMGYFLLYESMLDSVIRARDKFLKPDGMIFPDRATIHVATLEDEAQQQEKIEFWENVYGVNMKCMQKWVLREPIVECLDKEAINSNDCIIFDIDLKKCTVEDLDFSNEYNLKIQRNDYVHGLISWFDCYFNDSHLPIKLSTSPYIQPTHWKQTIFYFENYFPVNKDDEIHGSIAVKKNAKNPRNLNIKISYHLQKTQFNGVHSYIMN